jgi:hypothetical protein
MSDCLHCDVNDLVEKELEREDADLAELAARLTESLADLILLAPPGDQSKLMADVLSNLGQAGLSGKDWGYRVDAAALTWRDDTMSPRYRFSS